MYKSFIGEHKSEIHNANGRQQRNKCAHMEDMHKTACSNRLLDVIESESESGSFTDPGGNFFVSLCVATAQTHGDIFSTVKISPIKTHYEIH